MRVFIGPYSGGSSEQEIKVEIDNHDTWNLDYTLAQIIYPALVRLKEFKKGIPSVNESDLPENLKSDNPFDPKNWEWVLDEMIFAFKCISEDNTGGWDWPKSDRDRIYNGLRLFGVYYTALWC